MLCYIYLLTGVHIIDKGHLSQPVYRRRDVEDFLDRYRAAENKEAFVEETKQVTSKLMAVRLFPNQCISP